MYFKSKVDWWVPAVVVFTVVMCFIGPGLEGDWWAGAVLAAILLALEILMFAGVKYQIKGNMLGIRNFFRWSWFPIDKIAEVKRQKSVLAAPALSFDRLAIKFSDKTILKSSMPLEISPKDVSGFIAMLKSINPEIIVKENGAKSK